MNPTATKPRIIVAGEADLPSAITSATSLIVATCMVCHEERPAGEQRDGICLDCRVGRALASHFGRLVELMRKQRKYAARHVPTTGTDEQIGRELRRMWAVIAETVPLKNRRHDFMTRAISRAEQLAA